MIDVIIENFQKFIQWCMENPDDVYSCCQIVDFIWSKIAPKCRKKDEEPPAPTQEDSSDKQQNDKD